MATIEFIESIVSALKAIGPQNGQIFAPTNVVVVSDLDDWIRRNLSIAVDVSQDDIAIHAHVKPGRTADQLQQYIKSALADFEVTDFDGVLIVETPQEPKEEDPDA